MSPVAGIIIRHQRRCTRRETGQCDCKPSYQPWAWSKADGKKIYGGTYPTRAAAKSWRTDAAKDVKDGKRRAPTPETVREAGEALVSGMEDGSIRDRSGKVYKPSTIRSYKRDLENYIYPEFGSRKLSSITYPDLQDFVDRLASEGLDGQTIRNITNPLRRIFKKHRYTIPVNPTTGLEIIAARKKPRRYVSPDLAKTMLDAHSLEDRAIWATDFYGGLRRGELQALRVENIELFDGWGLLHVEGSWDAVEERSKPRAALGSA
jgi:integrase